MDENVIFTHADGISGSALTGEVTVRTTVTLNGSQYEVYTDIPYEAVLEICGFVDRIKEDTPSE